MSFISELKQKAGELGLCKHRVEEWDTDIYFNPVTPHETGLVRKTLGVDEPPISYSVQMVILKALDKTGKRRFKNEDFDELVHLPYQSAIIELAAKMQERPDVDELKKSFTKTTS